jgi:hypothetical protein
VSPVHRRRSPHGARWPLRPRSSSPASRHPVRAHSLFLPFLSSPAARVEPAHRLRPWPSTRHRRHCCSDHRIAPSTPPSCPELRLSLAQPVLTPVARGKHHLHVNRSSEFRSCSSEWAAPWSSPLRSTFCPSCVRVLFASTHRCSSTLPVTVAGSGMAGRRPSVPPLCHWRR